MNVFNTIIQAIIQGLTEFLPISSSGHLVLFQQFFHVNQPNLLIDVFLHFGTLLAVLIYFAKDIESLTIGFLKAPFSFKKTETDFMWKIVVASIPTAILGIIIEKYFSNVFESLTIVLIDLSLTAILLFVSDFFKKKDKDIFGLSWLDVILIGTVQGLAVFPGISRSGSTIVIALLLGMKRKEAGVFSFFIAIPALLGALILGLKGVNVVCSSNLIINLFLGVGISFLVGLASIKILFVILKKAQFKFFSFYLIGLVSLAVFFKLIFHI